MENNQDNEVIYPTTIEDLQIAAVNRVGRKLTDDELYTAKKCVAWGLSSIVDITLKSAIDEAIE